MLLVSKGHDRHIRICHIPGNNVRLETINMALYLGLMYSKVSKMIAIVGIV